MVRAGSEDSLVEVILPDVRRQVSLVEEGAEQERGEQDVQRGGLEENKVREREKVHGDELASPLGARSKVIEQEEIDLGEGLPRPLPAPVPAPLPSPPPGPRRSARTTAGVHSNLHWLPRSAVSRLAARGANPSRVAQLQQTCVALACLGPWVARATPEI